jgi:uncharacterized membrane protein YeaQ/YmgE (transglycosylase-associated protein family)
MGLLYTIIIGAVCGYIADVLMSDNGFGLLINIIIGIIGSFVGKWAFGALGINVNFGNAIVNDIVVGASGAIIILFIVGLIRGGRRRR